MRVIKTMLSGAVALTLLAPQWSALADDPVKVVASFSVLGDLVAQVGKGRVQVVTLLGPDGDAHVYAPTPADAQSVATAHLLVVNGLGFEGWLDRLVEASGYDGIVLIASEGVAPIMSADKGNDEPGHGHEGEEGEDQHGAADPHAWQSADNARIYVENIAKALCAEQPVHCTEFKNNASDYVRRLEDLNAELKAAFASVPEEHRKVITSHDAFAYLGREYGVHFVAAQAASTDTEASAADVAALIGQIRAEGVSALFVENISDPRLMQQIAAETGVKVGGTLFSDALSGKEGPAPTYIDMMRHNAGLLLNAMQRS